jgi:hypothetical protein
MSSILEKHYVMCNDCKRTTNHVVRANHRAEEVVYVKDNYSLTIDHYYQVIECAGCNRVSFVYLQPVDGEGFKIIQYPTPIESELEGKLLDEKEIWQLPAELRELYLEVRIAVLHEAYLLAGIGLRTLVEGICLDRNITGYNLMQKINALKDARIILDHEAPILHKLRLIGNAGTHDIETKDYEVLKYALMIITHTLRTIYIIPGIGDKIP